jgi:putative hydrolase of the HAD superfamily
MKMIGQTLLFDADDTLWENNIYFERAIAGFISYLDHRVHSIEEVREHLNRVERKTIATYGYGLKSFRRSLIQTFEDLSDTPMTAARHERIVSFVDSIANQEIELMAGVAETLPQLAQRHTLMLVTKGDDTEQREKLAMSGIAGYFGAVEVLKEKSEDAYRELAGRHRLDLANSWMIGNSPKSDINPSLAAGLNAVFIPHDFTWVLEHETVAAAPTGQRLIRVDAMEAVLEYF